MKKENIQYRRTGGKRYNKVTSGVTITVWGLIVYGYRAVRWGKDCSSYNNNKTASHHFSTYPLRRYIITTTTMTIAPTVSPPNQLSLTVQSVFVYPHLPWDQRRNTSRRMVDPQSKLRISCNSRASLADNEAAAELLDDSAMEEGVKPALPLLVLACCCCWCSCCICSVSAATRDALCWAGVEALFVCSPMATHDRFPMVTLFCEFFTWMTQKNNCILSLLFFCYFSDCVLLFSLFSSRFSLFSQFNHHLVTWTWPFFVHPFFPLISFAIH